MSNHPTASTLALPRPPAELWMLWCPDGGPEDRGCFVVSVDDAPGGETFLACMSEAEARKAAEYQAEVYDCDCVPVRVK